MTGYTIGPQRRSIECHTCGRTSYNSEDVRNLYCAFCHRFHEEPLATIAPALQYRAEQQRLRPLHFPDNSVYVKSDNMTSTQLLEQNLRGKSQSVDGARIEELAKTDATIRSCLVMVRNGVMTYEAALEGLVVLLHQQKEAAVNVALEAMTRALPPALVPTDPNQAALQLDAGARADSGQ